MPAPDVSASPESNGPRWEAARGTKNQRIRALPQHRQPSGSSDAHPGGRPRLALLPTVFLSQQRVRTCDVVVGELLLGSGRVRRPCSASCASLYG